MHMARTTLSPLAPTLRGSVGNATFSHSKRQTYLKLRKTPQDPQSAAQLAHRSAYAQTPDFWRSLSLQLRQAYAASTLVQTHAGYHVFVSRNWQHLRDSDGLHGPGPTPGQGPRVELTTGLWFRNMWWGDDMGMATWVDPGQGPDYRMGFILYDATHNRFAAEDLNWTPLSAEYATIHIPFGLAYYLFALVIQRLSDGELVHSEFDAAWVA